MKKLAVGFALCGALIILAGCAAPQPEETPTLPAMGTMTASATASATPMATSTPTPGFVRQVSFEIQPSLPEGHLYAGNLLLENLARDEKNLVSLYSLQSGERLLFSEKYYSADAVSPDRTRFAVLNSWGETYDIYSASGELIKSIPWEGLDGHIADWLDNERIGILTYTDFRDGWSVIGPDTVTFINTITGEEKAYPPDYPDLDLANQPLYHGKWGTAVFDPDLTRIIYPNSYGNFNLYSLTEKKILAELPKFQFRSTILWVTDGSYFIAVDDKNFYRVSVDGEVKQITDFEDSANQSFSIMSTYALSPDESRVAFWLKTGPKDQEETEYVLTLAVLDLKSGEVVDVGIFSGDDFWNDFLGRIAPVWSPDSRSLIVFANWQSDDYDLLLVDLEEQMAYKLPENWYVTGWLLPEEPDAVFPTRTSTPVPVATPTPQPVKSANMEIQSASPEDLPYIGSLLLANPDRSSEEKHLLYELDTGEIKLLPEYYQAAHAVSPDRTKFVLYRYVKDGINISVFSAAGNRPFKVDGQEDWGRVADWIDNDRLAIVLYEEDEDSLYSKYPPSIVIYNFNTGGTQLLTTDYPDVRGSWFTSLREWGATVFDPSLTRAVYTGRMPSPHPEIKFTDGYILYSVPGQRKLVQIPANTDTLPIWAADGSYFIVQGNDEFYKVSSGGQIKKLTSLNPGYRFGEEESLDYLLDYYSLSPDESRLAFWMTRYDKDLAWENTRYTLAVLDLTTGEIWDTCISSDHRRDFAINFTILPRPIWSPDSKSLVVSASSGEESGRNLVLVDLESMTAYQLPSDWIPTGWLLPED